MKNTVLVFLIVRFLWFPTKVLWLQLTVKAIYPDIKIKLGRWDGSPEGQFNPMVLVFFAPLFPWMYVFAKSRVRFPWVRATWVEVFLGRRIVGTNSERSTRAINFSLPHYTGTALVYKAFKHLLLLPSTKYSNYNT